MANCKILGPQDLGIVSEFVEILQARLKDLEELDHGTTIAEAVKKYTLGYISENIQVNGKKRFIGHFNPSLDGVLVEESDKVKAPRLIVKRAIINWVMAKISGRGIGSELISDSIERAKQRKEDVVALAVFSRNTQARALYERLGFELNTCYDNKRKLLMCYYINPDIRPR